MRRNQLYIPAAMAILTLWCACYAGENGADSTEQQYQQAREAMVKRQIEARGITDDAVLKAMRSIPRHLFVPRYYRKYSYSDSPLPIGEGQTISQPYIVALMTELLGLTGDEKVLEIGTGSGYQAAILAEITDSVFSIEIVEPLANRSRALLDSLGYKNVIVRYGDGYAGWEEEAPFAAIIVTAAPPEIPQALIEQLAEGGRMVVPVGTVWQELVLIEKVAGELIEHSVAPVRFVPMIHDDD